MTKVLCELSVAIMMGKIPIITNAQLLGTVITENKVNYLADFSKEAKMRDYVGDYSRILIKKDKCLEVPK